MPEPYLPERNKTWVEGDSNPCAGCSYCCEYIALEIDKPESVKDFDQILWFLIHKDVWVYIDDTGAWHLQFNTPCEKLENRRCGYYAHRPAICRDYSPQECSRYGEGEDETALFKNEDDLFRYLARRRPRTFAKLGAKLGHNAAYPAKPA